MKQIHFLKYKSIHPSKSPEYTLIRNIPVLWIDIYALYEKAGPLADEVRIPQTFIRFFLLTDQNGKPNSFFLDIDFDQLWLIC